MDKTKIVLLFLVGLLLGGAIGYHSRPRIVAHTGGVGDETAVLLMLKKCEEKLTLIQRELNHSHQLLHVYQELNKIRKSNTDE